MAGVLALTLPESLDPDTLRTLAIGLIVVVLLGALWVLRFVQKLVTRAALLALCVALIGALWLQRGELGECQRTCECQLFFQDVQVPGTTDGIRCDV